MMQAIESSPRQAPVTATRSIGAMVVALLVSLLVPRAAIGQADDMLPGPMSTPELGEYMDRLGLSPQQQLAVEAMHDQYKREYRELQETQFAKFSDFMQQINSMFPAREDVEKLLDMQESIFGRIRAIDERLFNQMQSLLTEQQLAIMPRVRLARERERYMANEMMWSMGQRPVDVSKLYHDLDLDDAEREATEPLVIDYERQVTRDIARLHKSTTGMFMRMFDELEKAGFTEESMNDPEQQMAMMEQMQGVFMQVTAEQRERAWDVHDQGKRLFSMLRQTLPAKPARQLRSAYYREAYPQIGWMMPDAMVGSREDLDHVEDLTDEQRDRLEAEIFTPLAELDRELDGLVEVYEKMAREQNPFNFDASAWEEEQKVITAFQEKVNKFQRNVWNTLSEILSPEQMHAFSVARTERMSGGNAMMAAEVEGAADAVVGEQEAGMSWGPDQFIAREISDSDVRLYAHVLGLDESGKTLLRELHHTYMDANNTYQRDAISKLTEVTSSLWQMDEQTGAYTPPTMAAYDRLYEVRANTLAKLRAMDARFFDDVALTLGETAGERKVQRIRMMRERDIYNRGHWNYGQSGQAWSIDMVKFVLRLRLSDEEIAAIEPILHAYEQQAGALFKQKYEAAKRWQRANDEWNAVAQAMQQEGTWDQTSWQEYQQRLSGPTNALDAANKALADLNTQTFEQVHAQLAADHAALLRRSFLRTAYPQVYTDSTSPERHFERALALDSLTAEQRSRLEEAALEYNAKYAQFNEQLVELYSEQPSRIGVVTDQEAIMNSQRMREKIDRVQFDRSELNSRGIRHLKQILTPEQIDAIGGLPVVSD